VNTTQVVQESLELYDHSLTFQETLAAIPDLYDAKPETPQ
jgi:hypothetical protein